ncbi:hypothetical protein [Candidatus Electronema sp. PJ]|uniref:hypothetical protein n=1 Tax=Candidatus Electronema sp. PJ TaxID=3401572 RepID=UPI003AA89051
MPAPYQSIEDRLSLYKTSLVNASEVPDLQSRLAPYGYTPLKLGQMLTFRQDVFDLYVAQKSEYSEQLAATQAFEQAWDAAHTAYIRLVKLGRILFKDDYAVFVKLGLNEERKRSFSGWLTQARQFFSNLLADPAAVAKFGLYNTPSSTINEALALVTTTEDLHIAKAKESGEAQQATLNRDGELDMLDKGMSEFYAIARLACEDAPQLLEMLGIVVGE